MNILIYIYNCIINNVIKFTRNDSYMKQYSDILKIVRIRVQKFLILRRQYELELWINSIIKFFLKWIFIFIEKILNILLNDTKLVLFNLFNILKNKRFKLPSMFEISIIAHKWEKMLNNDIFLI